LIWKIDTSIKKNYGFDIKKNLMEDKRKIQAAEGAHSSAQKAHPTSEFTIVV